MSTTKPPVYESELADLGASLLMLYLGIGLLFGWLAGIITFVAVYIAAVGSVGWVIGIALGWIPSMLAAGLAYFIFRWLWPLIAVGVAWLLYVAWQ